MWLPCFPRCCGLLRAAVKSSVQPGSMSISMRIAGIGDGHGDACSRQRDSTRLKRPSAMHSHTVCRPTMRWRRCDQAIKTRGCTAASYLLSYFHQFSIDYRSRIQASLGEGRWLIPSLFPSLFPHSNFLQSALSPHPDGSVSDSYAIISRTRLLCSFRLSCMGKLHNRSLPLWSIPVRGAAVRAPMVIEGQGGAMAGSFAGAKGGDC